MQSEHAKVLPSVLRPATYFGGRKLTSTYNCPMCPTLFTASNGVACLGTWTRTFGDGEDDVETIHSTLIFCSLKCLLIAIDSEGNA